MANIKNDKYLANEISLFEALIKFEKGSSLNPEKDSE